MTPISYRRIESGTIALVGLMVYHTLGHGWVTFVLTLLLPDLAMLGYLRGPNVGAWVYNLAHSYALPMLIAAAGLMTGSDLAVAAAVIWSIHIALDRALGFGLKYASGFKDTDLKKL